MKENRSKRPYYIGIVAFVAVVVIVAVLAFGGIPRSAGAVSINKASLSWEYSNFDQKYHVKTITVELTNNGKDQIFDLFIDVKGNWPVEYENEKGFYIRVGAGLNPGETRTISDSVSNNWNIDSATKQTGTYTATLQVIKYKYNDPIVNQVENVYGERMIDTHVP